jgi:predicted PurR-regulated permease PerM
VESTGAPKTGDSALKTGVKLMAVGAALLVAWLASDLLLIVFAGVLFGIFLEALTRWIARRAGLAHGWSLAVVVVMLSCLLGLLAWRAYPKLAEQAHDLGERLPQAVQSLRTAVEASPLSALIGQGGGSTARVRRVAFSWAEGAVSAVMTASTAIVVIVLVGIYLAAEPRLYRDGAIRLLPRPARDRARQVISKLGEVLERWIVARIVLMVINGGLTAIGLWVLGIPLALILGVIAGLLNFVPNIGPLIAAVPAILIGWMQGPGAALWVAGLYLFLQSLDGYVFTPLAQKKAVSLPPALIITFQVLMGMLAGPLGLLLATPLAATLFVLVKMLYLNDSP